MTSSTAIRVPSAPSTTPLAKLNLILPDDRTAIDPTAGLTPLRDLLLAGYYERMARHLAGKNGWEIEYAEAVLDNALLFLVVKGLLRANGKPDTELSPSLIPDEAWHVFLDYTWPYEALTVGRLGGFIHHEPNDVPGATPKKGGVLRTKEAILAFGFELDERFWPTVASAHADRCGDTHPCD